MSQVLFLAIAGPGLVMALLTVLSRNLIHAALYLVAFFFVVACLFVMLEAEFLAAMQVLVYVGAVAILLLFGIMLTRNIQGDETTRTKAIVVVPAGAIALGLLAVLVLTIAREPGMPGRAAWSSGARRPPSAADSPTALLPPRAPTINNMAKTIGDELMGRHVVAFELAGLLLTVAVVGAVAISIREGVAPPVPEAAVPDTTPEEAPLETASVPT
mgnify:CR=1 FL=1